MGDDGSGSYSNIIAGMRWVKSHVASRGYRQAVAVMSLGACAAHLRPPPPARRSRRCLPHLWRLSQRLVLTYHVASLSLAQNPQLKPPKP